VTGSHNLKAGVNLEWGDSRNRIDNNRSISTLTFVNNAANSVTVRNTPVVRLDQLHGDSGFFVQDRWTLKKLSLFGGYRYDWFNGGWPDEHAAANPFVAVRDIQSADCQPCYRDWSLRAGGSYDLFGTGKTALKLSVGKFLAANALGTTSSLNPLGAQSNTRTWRDTNLDGTVVNPDGSIQFSEIGATTNNNFGLPAGSLVIDPKLKRGNNWEEAVSVQHELFKNVSVTGGYYRRQFYNLTATVNTVINPATDYTAFTVVGPTHPNLPNGGGEIITLYNLNANKQGAVSNVLMNAPDRSRNYDGYEVSVNARIPRGFAFGGVTIERTVTDNCASVSNPNDLRYCRPEPPFRALYKGSTGYLLPYDIQLAGSFQARPGIPLGAAWTVTSAVSQAAGGQALTAGVSSITVELMNPEKYFYDYVYTNDLTVSRIFRLGDRRRLRAYTEIFNVLNTSTIFTRNETFGTQWYNPVNLVDARRFQFGAQFDW
jgi:hypothetical protein